MNTRLIISSETVANAFEFMGTLIVLILAFLMQFIFKELPCPLCLLQRFGFLMVAYGFLLNFRFGFRPSHYSVVLLGALFTSFVALRQVALHVIPGTGAYGSAIFGMHLYTWSFVFSMAIVVGTTLLFGIDRQYLVAFRPSRRFRTMTNVFAVALAVLLIANMVSVYLECGLKQCPDNPVGYAEKL